MNDFAVNRPASAGQTERKTTDQNINSSTPNELGGAAAAESLGAAAPSTVDELLARRQEIGARLNEIASERRLIKRKLKAIAVLLEGET